MFKAHKGDPRTAKDRHVRRQAIWDAIKKVRAGETVEVELGRAHGKPKRYRLSPKADDPGEYPGLQLYAIKIGKRIVVAELVGKDAYPRFRLGGVDSISVDMKNVVEDIAAGRRPNWGPEKRLGWNDVLALAERLP